MRVMGQNFMSNSGILPDCLAAILVALFAGEAGKMPTLTETGWKPVLRELI